MEIGIIDISVITVLIFETYIFPNLAFDLEDVLGTWNVLVKGVGDGTVSCFTTSSTVKSFDFSNYGIRIMKSSHMELTGLRVNSNI